MIHDCWKENVCVRKKKTKPRNKLNKTNDTNNDLQIRNQTETDEKKNKRKKKL